MGRFDQLLNTIGIQPKKPAILAKAQGDENLPQLRARLAKKGKPRTVIVLAKAKPAEKPAKPLPKDMAELRRELDEAVIAGKISGTDARDICHQLAAGAPLPDDLAIRLAAVLGIESKPNSFNQKRTPQMKADLQAQLARAVQEKKVTAAEAAKAEHLLNNGLELPDHLKVLLGKYTQ